MKKMALSVVLSLLVAVQVLGAPHRPSHRPSPREVSPIARVWAQLRAFLRGSELSGDEHSLPPPPSTVVSPG
ncbi:MAG: hypothetical protein ACRD16_14045 [Thermoanaerobaculia bacterium]